MFCIKTFRASGGELQRVLDEEESLEEINAVKVMVQILEGLSFLHAQNIAHLDLKVVDNLLNILSLKKFSL